MLRLSHYKGHLFSSDVSVSASVCAAVVAQSTQPTGPAAINLCCWSVIWPTRLLWSPSSTPYLVMYNERMVTREWRMALTMAPSPSPSQEVQIVPHEHNKPTKESREFGAGSVCYGSMNIRGPPIQLRSMGQNHLHEMWAKVIYFVVANASKSFHEPY